MEIKSKENREKFAQEFIERYSRAGFGSMNKSDFEILVFDLLRKYGDIKGVSNYKASVKLHVPETKIRKLAYEADLRYGNIKEEDIPVMFFSLIKDQKFRAEGNRIIFSIENRMVRESISDKLKELNHFADTSFNRELVTVHLDSFIELLEAYYPAAATGRIEKECRKEVKKEKGEEPTFKMIMRKFLEGASSRLGSKVVDVAAFFISGGTDIGFVNDICAAWKSDDPS